MVKSPALFWKNNKMIRYIFFGGMTTIVNFLVFYILRNICLLPLTAANIVSVAAAVLFAYLVNSRFVFTSGQRLWKARIREFIEFTAARVLTMLIEVGGVWLMAEATGIDDMISKIMMQLIVLALNYIFSRFLIFTGSEIVNHRTDKK